MTRSITKLTERNPSRISRVLEKQVNGYSKKG